MHIDAWIEILQVILRKPGYGLTTLVEDFVPVVTVETDCTGTQQCGWWLL